MGEVILENLIPLVFTVITPVLLMFVNRGLTIMAKRWNLDEALVYQDQIDDLILKGIKAAEKKSLNAVKKGGEVTPGEEKLGSVLKFVNAQLEGMGLPQKAATELETLVEAKLFDGVKDTRATTVTVRSDAEDTHDTANLRVPTIDD